MKVNKMYDLNKPYISFDIAQYFPHIDIDKNTLSRKELKKYYKLLVCFHNGGEDKKSSTCRVINIQRFMSFYNLNNYKELKSFIENNINNKLIWE